MEPIKFDMMESKSSGSLLDQSFSASDIEMEVLKQQLAMADDEDKAALEAERRMLQLVLLEAFAQQRQLVVAQTKLVKEYSKSEDK
ncbi:hypothetical protein GOBAR_AA32806 [Gossypium barbadense]|uniref:GTD-binding domain-containing protein n=1 Tax=Gossypium barbadense TaxID=3634 RepID=A0A2P5W9V3_GOSBA|nr:hypothetical protein GOBAR_AA32806 [Gossypium barbadense]